MRGGHTHAKEEFDCLARDYFGARGYDATLLGGQLADVVAWHPRRKELAIIEVKGPWEEGPQIEYRYKSSDYHLADRRDLWEKLKKRDFAIECPSSCWLIASAVSHQLYRYWKLQKRHVESYRRREGKIAGNVVPNTYTAFLVGPKQRKRLTTSVLRFFKERRMIKSFGMSESGPIYVAKIGYWPYKVG